MQNSFVLRKYAWPFFCTTALSSEIEGLNCSVCRFAVLWVSIRQGYRFHKRIAFQF